MIDKLAFYFVLFIIYAFLGWCMEMVFCYFNTKKWVDRGFLIGPICPIYGYGCLGIILLLKKYYDDPIVLFTMAVLICSLLEYFTSYAMEKLFKARWWDYSDKKFNINGRICLELIFAFGLLGLLVMYGINPLISGLLSKVNITVLKVVALILLVLYLVDNIISFKIISGFKNVAKSVKKDNTEEITKKVKELLIKKGGLYKRLVTAFNFEASEKLLKDFKAHIKNTAKKAKNKIMAEKEKNNLKREEIILEYETKVKEFKEKIKEEKIKKKNRLKKIK